MTGLITSSRLKVFRRCRREHHLRYVLGRTAQATRAQDFGTLVHLGLEAWWGAKQAGMGGDAPLVAALSAMIGNGTGPDVDPYDLARAEAMLAGYDCRWGDERYEVLAVEAEFRATIEPAPQMVRGDLSANMLRRVADLKRNGRWGRCGFCPDDPAACEFADRYDHKLTAEALDQSLGWQLRKEMLGSEPVKLGGKLDALVRDADGRVLIVEHKTSSEDISAGSAYWARLRMDGQVSLYYLGAEALGYEVAGVLYDVLAKPGAKPLKATATPKLKKDGKPYAGQRLADETPDEYWQRIGEAIGADPNKYFARTEIVRLEGERAAHLEELRAEVREMQTAAPLSNPDSCVRFGSVCSFFPACSGERRIDEYTAISWPHPELTEDK